MKNFINGTYDNSLIGKKFNKLTIVKFHGFKKNKNGHNLKYWECKCECGNYCITEQYRIKSGKAKSCGCYIKERQRDLHIIHNECKTRLYKIWEAMKRRCDKSTDINYKNYGGKGITYCDEWKEYIPFRDWALKNGYKENLTIDRYPNQEGNYNQSNCRWATPKQQANNKKNNRIINYKNEKLTLMQWSDKLNIPPSTLYNRLSKLGWSIERSLTTKSRNYG